MGWLSAKSRHTILILKLWNRLCNISESRLTRRVFDWDRQYSNTRGTWSHAARQALSDIESSMSFIEVSPCNIDSALEKVRTIDVDTWDFKRYNPQKLRYYNLYKYDKSSEEYLLLDITKYQRSVFAQFRCGILPLEIEVGRYRNSPLPERTCQVCSFAVEDEIHFLLTCNAYSNPRSRLITKAIEFDNSFTQLEEIDQFVLLVSNLQKPVIQFLTNALTIRTNLLNRYSDN